MLAKPRFAGGSIANHGQKFPTRFAVFPKGAEHTAGHHGHSSLLHATGRHALVRGLNDHCSPKRLQDFVNGVGHLRGQFFLYLKAFSVSLDEARQL